jgi:hypothetical protein
VSRRSRRRRVSVSVASVVRETLGDERICPRPLHPSRLLLVREVVTAMRRLRMDRAPKVVLDSLVGLAHCSHCSFWLWLWAGLQRPRRLSLVLPPMFGEAARPRFMGLASPAQNETFSVPSAAQDARHRALPVACGDPSKLHQSWRRMPGERSALLRERALSRLRAPLGPLCRPPGREP